ncbi:class I poly(R)-hydroxyalkanoic acid synthase [Bordetella parapertussis]|uniref:Poly-beta-hydroxybutyrate polymerase n=2 Tax=Bordetella parapertussis TaxID=519 RepID=Q7W5U2_BORPA|nr:class I poly(R)-hydroxyalkanoic acid synthase [Bordetella parapertussis]AOB40169.1 class I poly(R)-hydroxyalkanoic acid synthase [Bordetella parapertussis]AUL44188.1 class I poly(R)-hydroxyalkanoic acid synthase [Bordetella parapertussis]AWP64092.1 class I poly(R)-hydroxyalkanoic acid synthase [Bordetella parapertussis]AWP71596.1 class I poly(R)-hydroxyalkanoic acid synthase [Bordetella parapertussis]AWP90201.1 class I poly(R)-hydroxyalkanoic acid synthase [Bordetella parapertussis]
MNAHLSAAWPVPVSVAPDALAEIQADFSREWLRLCDEAKRGVLGAPADKRFAGAAWLDDRQRLLMAHAYLLSARAMARLVEAAQVSELMRNRLRFSVMQWVDAMSPANFLAFNPDAQRAIVESAGRTLQEGMANLLNDIQRGRISQTDETQFEIGRNVATTPGHVVFENSLMQLIQYAPQTAKVCERPLVIVPPNINKYYILDLQPENSFVRYAVEQGHTVFIISWRNPLAADTDGVDTATWSEYLDDAVLKALAVASDISGQPQVNALGFCVGGTMLASALALAQARGERPVASLTLLTSLLDFHDTGILKVFVDEAHALLRDHQYGQRGLMPARDLATTFSFLRPNELVWNYVVSNYLKGKTPPAFDLLFWNADSTNLPGPFFAWYFRNTYLENNLKVPGRARAAGVPLDLTRLDMPAYLYGSREDHIVPWPSAYASTQLLRGPMRFVLGASGHIAGVINPPAKQRRSYWVNESAGAVSHDLPGDPNAWLAGAVEHAGSWWPDWTAWLAGHGGKQVAAPAQAGNKRFRPIEPAPGRYVKVRAV